MHARIAGKGRKRDLLIEIRSSAFSLLFTGWESGDCGERECEKRGWRRGEREANRETNIALGKQMYITQTLVLIC